MKLFKRSDATADAPYYVQFKIKRKRYMWCTKTSNHGLAMKRAKAHREAVVEQNYGLVEMMKSRSTAASFAQLFEQYETLPEPSKAHTKKRNIAAMRQIMAVAGLGEQDRLDRLNGQAGVKYQAEASKRGLAPAAINATLRMAKSLFSQAAMAGYGMAGLTVPDTVTTLFKVVRPLREPKRRPELPTPDALANANTHLPKLPAHWRAYLLAGTCGLRAGEIVAARKSWIRNGVLTIGGTAEFETKDKDWRTVNLDPEVEKLLLAGDGPYIVSQNPAWVVNRELTAMLKGYGFPDKPLQSLRRLAGTIIAMQNSAIMARDFLGHSSVATSEAFYINPNTRAAPISMATLTGSGGPALPAFSGKAS